MVSHQDQEILRLYDDERLTQKQIAYRLEIDQSTISRILKKLRKIHVGKGMHKKRDVVNIHNSTLWRYHALEFTISPYYFYPRYGIIRKERGTWFTHREWRIKLHEKNVELKLRRGFEFVHEDKLESMSMAEESLNRTLFEISNSCGFQYEKEGRISIRLNKQHLAKTNSPMAKAQKGQYMQVKGIDGKVWFLIDRSKGLPEHEYCHTGRLSEDSHTTEAFLDDLRENPHLSLSVLNQQQQFSTQAIKELTVQIKKHLEVLSQMSHTMKDMRDLFKEFRKDLKKD